jgi:hypothetical protein
LNFKPTERSSFCRRGDAEAKIKDFDKRIVIGLCLLANELVLLFQIKFHLSIANCNCIFIHLRVIM